MDFDKECAKNEEGPLFVLDSWLYRLQYDNRKKYFKKIKNGKDNEIQRNIYLIDWLIN